MRKEDKLIELLEIRKLGTAQELSVFASNLTDDDREEIYTLCVKTMKYMKDLQQIEDEFRRLSNAKIKY